MNPHSVPCIQQMDSVERVLRGARLQARRMPGQQAMKILSGAARGERRSGRSKHPLRRLRLQNIAARKRTRGSGRRPRARVRTGSVGQRFRGRGNRASASRGRQLSGTERYPLGRWRRTRVNAALRKDGRAGRRCRRHRSRSSRHHGQPAAARDALGRAEGVSPEAAQIRPQFSPRIPPSKNDTTVRGAREERCGPRN